MLKNRRRYTFNEISMRLIICDCSILNNLNFRYSRGCDRVTNEFYVPLCKTSLGPYY